MSTGTLVILLLARLIGMVGVVVAAVPLVYASPHPFPWGNLAGLIAAFGFYVGTYFFGDYHVWLTRRTGHPHDVALFKELLDLLKPAEVRILYRDFDFGGAFRYEDVSAVNRFVDGWKSADKDFRDRGIEKAKRDIYTKAAVVAREIAYRTRPLTGGLQTVKLANVDQQPESVREDAGVINEAASQFAKSYEAFVRLGRDRLTLV